MAKASIMVFDSGVGGLSVLAEIQKRLPDCHYTYLSDNAAFPYGTKSESVLITRINQLLTQALARYPTDILVIACNSASTLALPSVRQNFSLPVVGVVPAIKPAVESSRSGVIGLLATPGTVARRYTHDLIRDFAGNSKVFLEGSNRLVEVAERKLYGTAPCPDELRNLLAPLFKADNENKMDTVVLACTHFPLLKEELSQISERDIEWVDSGEAVARRTQHLLEQLPKTIETHSRTEDTNPGVSSESVVSENIAVFTAQKDAIPELKGMLAHYRLNRIELCELAYT